MNDLNGHSSAEPLDKGSDENAFWVICDAGGIVCLCSDGAAKSGVSVGVTYGKDLVYVEDRADFEDALRKCVKGGDVSVLLNADAETGYGLVHIKRITLFSSFAAEVRLYKDRNEYLAASHIINERNGRVFDYINDFTEEFNKILSEVSDIYGDGSFPEGSDSKTASLSKRVSCIGELSFIKNYNRDEEDICICDVTKIFDMIDSATKDNKNIPFSMKLVKNVSEKLVMCTTETKRFVGIVIAAAAVAARLSKNKECKVMLTNSDNSVIIEAECTLYKKFDLYGRSDDFDNIYKCIPASPMELMAFEQLISVPEWHGEYYADGDGRIVIRAVLAQMADADRLKYRDGTKNVKENLEEFLGYIEGGFLLDSQK